jgi:Fe-S oxidoreductase
MPSQILPHQPFQEYPKQFESVYPQKYCNNACKIDKVTTDLGISTTDYANKIRELLKEYQQNSFDTLVKFYWLVRKFTYLGKTRYKRCANGMVLEHAFSAFFLNHVKISNRIITGDSVLSRISTYLDDIFPDFDAMDPFKDEMKYPYSYVNFDHLFLVYQMEDRMKFIKIAEERKMTYLEFLDYVANWVGSYNEKYGDTYVIKNNVHFAVVPLYIGKMKNLNVKRGKG